MPWWSWRSRAGLATTANWRAWSLLDLVLSPSPQPHATGGQRSGGGRKRWSGPWSDRHAASGHDGRPVGTGGIDGGTLPRPEHTFLTGGTHDRQHLAWGPAWIADG